MDDELCQLRTLADTFPKAPPVYSAPPTSEAPVYSAPVESSWGAPEPSAPAETYPAPPAETYPAVSFDHHLYTPWPRVASDYLEDASVLRDIACDELE